MADAGGDFALSLSSEVIAEVMQRHFNKEMFKKQVKIVDLNPLQDGYQFLLAYTHSAEVVPHERVASVDDVILQRVAAANVADILEGQQVGLRDKNGRFTRAKGGTEHGSTT